MRVVFAGTPEFAAVALDALLRAGFTVPLVLTQPDRPAGRGMKLQASAVKQRALAAGLPVVAGNWRGVSEIVASGETGILIGPWDDIDFAEAVVELTRDNKRRIAMAEAAAARAESEHSMTAAVTVLNRALETACTLRRQARQ